MCMESAPPPPPPHTYRDSNRLIVCKARSSLLYVLIKLQADWMTPMATKLARVIDNLLCQAFQCVWNLPPPHTHTQGFQPTHRLQSSIVTSIRTNQITG